MDMNPEDPKDASQAADESPKPESPEAGPTQPVSEAEQKRLKAEEALAEMRRDLREEEKTKAPKGFTASLKRITDKLLRRKPQGVEEETGEAPSRLDELQFPEPTLEQGTAEAQAKEAAAAEETPQAQAAPTESETQFGTMVRNRLTDALAHKEELEPVVREEAPEQIEEPEPVGQARHPHGILADVREEGEGTQGDLSNIRQEALEGYEAPTEEEDEGHTSLAGRLQRSWRYMRPVERSLLIGALVIIGLAVIGASANAVRESIPTPTPTLTPTPSIVPIPISISLPGGWVFPLRTGYVDKDGVWRPKGAEWLSGTEICRWVSLPWTVQLEAVMRTLSANDEIKLSMSNYDSVTYKVQSIEQVPAAEISKLTTNTPSLLVILSKEDATARYVVKATP